MASRANIIALFDVDGTLTASRKVRPSRRSENDDRASEYLTIADAVTDACRRLPLS